MSVKTNVQARNRRPTEEITLNYEKVVWTY